MSQKGMTPMVLLSSVDVELISCPWRFSTKAFQHIQEARSVGPRGAVREHLFGRQRGHLLSQSGVDELVQAHAVTLGGAACRRQNALWRT
jgi:hypothetical protein